MVRATIKFRVMHTEGSPDLNDRARMAAAKAVAQAGASIMFWKTILDHKMGKKSHAQHLLEKCWKILTF